MICFDFSLDGFPTPPTQVSISVSSVLNEGEIAVAMEENLGYLGRVDGEFQKLPCGLVFVLLYFTMLKQHPAVG